MLLDDDSLLEKLPLVKADENEEAAPLPVKVHIDATTLWWEKITIFFVKLYFKGQEFSTCLTFQFKCGSFCMRVFLLSVCV